MDNIEKIDPKLVQKLHSLDRESIITIQVLSKVSSEFAEYLQHLNDTRVLDEVFPGMFIVSTRLSLVPIIAKHHSVEYIHEEKKADLSDLLDESQ